MRVTEATVADVAAVLAMRADDPEAGPADPRTGRYLEGRHHPGSALPARVMYLALCEERVVGYIAGHLSTRFDCEGELQYLYVGRDHRRRGAATALLRALSAWFAERGARRICVDVTPENLVARAFYARHGAVALKPEQPHWMVWSDMALVSTRRDRGA